MGKTVFRPGEIKKKPGEMMLRLVHSYEPVQKAAEPEDVPVYEGPTVEELERQAEDFRVQWEAEKKVMLDKAQADADEIVNKAKDAAFAEIKRQTDQAQVIKSDAQNNAAAILRKAQEDAQQILDNAKNDQDSIRKQASGKGYEEGHEEGFKAGHAEADRLVDRMHVILNEVMVRREEILDETEQQIIELVILMARKVIKVLSENQKSVVMNNVLQALKKVKGRGDVTIRVNLADLKLTSEHTQDFISRVENIRNIHILEDSTVEQGGCIVETDFGAIDARISSQLNELEQKIIEISPIKLVSKSDVLEPNT
jgi:flagellar assembly protein FliH